MNKIRTIVVDDEYLNRDLVRQLIESIDLNFEIVADAENIDVAFDIINKYNPDVIFLDIKMPDGTGFDLLKKFKDPKFEVIFITGFDEYAIKAFEFNALDYVLKPIDMDKLKITLQRVFKRISEKKINGNIYNILDSYNNDYSKINKIPIHLNDKVFLLDIDKIISIRSDRGYTFFKTTDGVEFLSSKQLNSFEFIFNNDRKFCRINKSIYVNLLFIKSYSKGNICEITLVDNSAFEVSRRKKTEILALLELKN